MVIDHYMKSGQMVEAPVFTEGMISEASAIHEAHPEYLARELRQKILETDDNPFDSEYFTNIDHPDGREEAMREGTPCIILATSGMLEGGPVLEYFKNIAPHKKNKILFVSYQVNGTLGRRVLEGAKARKRHVPESLYNKGSYRHRVHTQGHQKRYDTHTEGYAACAKRCRETTHRCRRCIQNCKSQWSRNCKTWRGTYHSYAFGY